MYLGRLGFDTSILYKGHTEYQSENQSVADHAWDSFDTSAIAIAVPDDWSNKHKLPYTERFPWDDSKGMYFVKGLHQMHCLVSKPAIPCSPTNEARK
jgi:hypothetical protein